MELSVCAAIHLLLSVWVLIYFNFQNSLKVTLKNVLLCSHKGKKAQFKHWNFINAACPLICCTYKRHIGHICIICRSVCAFQKNPAGSSRGGSALSQPAHSDQAMSHKALLYVAAEWLVSVCCGGMTCIVNATFEGWVTVFLCIIIFFKYVEFGTSYWIAMFLEGTLGGWGGGWMAGR